MDSIDTFQYKMQFYNQTYLRAIKTPYRNHMLSFSKKSARAMDFAMQKPISETYDHRDKIEDPRQYIFDLVPMLFCKICSDPPLIKAAIASPTFGVSLFDVDPPNKGNLSQWIQKMQGLHDKIKASIEKGTRLDVDDCNAIETFHKLYRNNFDEDHMLNHDPMHYFLSIALMDVYHILNSNVYHNVEHFDFSPKFVLDAVTPDSYLQKYSSIFHIRPPEIKKRKMTDAFLNQMKQDFNDSKKIDAFLKDRNLGDLKKWRSDGFLGYHSLCYDIMTDLILKLLKIIQTSPIIINKEDLIRWLLHFNQCIREENAAFCYLKFAETYDKLIRDNIFKEELPFTFQHNKFFSPLPPLF